MDNDARNLLDYWRSRVEGMLDGLRSLLECGELTQARFDSVNARGHQRGLQAAGRLPGAAAERARIDQRMLTSGKLIGWLHTEGYLRSDADMGQIQKRVVALDPWEGGK